LIGESFDFELCTFTSNRATFEAGVLSVESGPLHVRESKRVLNQAELYVDVLKTTNATVRGDTLTFHAHRAAFQSAAVEADASDVDFTASLRDRHLSIDGGNGVLMSPCYGPPRWSNNQGHHIAPVRPRDVLPPGFIFTR
jgi:hypothetical protein